MRSKYPHTIELWGHTWRKPHGGQVWLGPMISDPEDAMLALAVECQRIIRRDGRYVLVDPSITLNRFCWTDDDELTILWPDDAV